MTDKPAESAVERYENMYAHVPANYLGTRGVAAVVNNARAAVAELKAERDAARSAQKKAQRRSDQIEAAMNDALKHPNRKFSHAVESGYKLAQRDLDELKAENEALRRERDALKHAFTHLRAHVDDRTETCAVCRGVVREYDRWQPRAELDREDL